ncbi:hypothetical protein ACWEGQ_28910 [Streptomyces seoulensis]
MAIGVCVSDERSFELSFRKQSAEFALHFSEKYSDGADVGFWLFTDKPVPIPRPAPGQLDSWGDDWLTTETHTERLRGEQKKNSLARLRREGKLFRGPRRLSPTMERIIEASAGLPGHTVAVLLLDASPSDGEAFMNTMRKAAEYPLFWVFVGTAWNEHCYLGVVETLGRAPGDPDNFLMLHTSNWSGLTRWLAARRIRRAVERWKKRTPVG